MIGTVYVMEAKDYEDWLAGGGAQGGTMAQKGEALFQQMGCVNCHLTNGEGRCPNLVGIWGRPQRTNVGVITADAAYVRESVLNPSAKIVEGYQNIMPTFQGLVTEEGIQQLIEYIKSIGPTGANQAAPVPGSKAPATAGPNAPGSNPPASQRLTH
jgi:cytochrome c oxidase subunit 2